MRDVVGEFGFDARDNAFDPLRLRVSTHRGFENPKAAPIYYAHRDTWYSHPACQISWWIPLHDLPPEQTFVFFPDFLRQPVENNSGEFDYDTWTRDRKSLRIGWQDPNARHDLALSRLPRNDGRRPACPFPARRERSSSSPEPIYTRR